MATDDPYSVLGVSSDASQRDIRDAYRARARGMHPDTVPAHERAAASQRMAELNAAWEVLSDPAKRRRHDEERSGRSAKSEPFYANVEPRPQSITPARFPWRAAMFFAVLGIVVVLVLNAMSSPGKPAAPDQLLQAGSCVSIDQTDAVSEVSCDGPHDGVVRVLIGFDLVCPSDTEAHRDRQGMGIACVDRSLASHTTGG